MQLNRELLLGLLSTSLALARLGQEVNKLPAYIDDAERDFGIAIYERMLNDPVLESSVNDLKVAVLSQGPRFLARVKAPFPGQDDPERQAEYEQAEEIRTFIEDMCDRLQQSFEDILSEVLDFLPFGHIVAEQTYEPRNGKLALTSLRVKPRRSYAFVVGPHMELTGLIAAKPMMGWISSGTPLSTEEIIPREKFLIVSHSTRFTDPRGRSCLRTSYNAWYLKQQTWPNYLKFLAQFGTPSIAGYLPPDAGDVEQVDAEGNTVFDDAGNPVTMTAEEAFVTKLAAFANGTAIALPNGSSLQLIQSTGDGAAYTKAFDLYDRQMTRGILIAARATMESEHGSRADSGTAADVLAQFTQFLRRKVEIAFFRDVIRPAVLYNYGQEAADSRLCPFLSLSSVAPENVAEVGNMIANLARAEVLHSSQYQGIDAMLGLPERDFQAQMDETVAAKEAAADRQAMLEGLLPGVGAEIGAQANAGGG
jgi:hypothetical protein